MLQALFGFHGRMRRSRYWAIGVGLAIVTVLAVIAAALLLPSPETADAPPTATNAAGFALLVAILLMFAWIRLAIQTKRWHDRGRSGWWSLATLIPFIGGVWMFVECGVLDGTVGPNKYGPSPKGPLNARDRRCWTGRGRESAARFVGMAPSP
jgi:uncharacterized membrane protein YhaH (DUF805 family)